MPSATGRRTRPPTQRTSRRVLQGVHGPHRRHITSRRQSSTCTRLQAVKARRCRQSSNLETAPGERRHCGGLFRLVRARGCAATITIHRHHHPQDHRTVCHKRNKKKIHTLYRTRDLHNHSFIFFFSSSFCDSFCCLPPQPSRRSRVIRNQASSGTSTSYVGFQ